MPDYRRARHPGGTYFFTLTLLRRRDNDLLTRHIEALRNAIRAVRRTHPFGIHGWVVLPDHLHCVVQLPENDTDFTLRLRLIKAGFSKSLPRTEWLSVVRQRRGERGIWQRRFWEHLIKDEADYRAHMDYVHINPVKHGLVKRVAGLALFHVPSPGNRGYLPHRLGRKRRGGVARLRRLTCGAIRCAIAPYVDFIAI